MKKVAIPIPSYEGQDLIEYIKTLTPSQGLFVAIPIPSYEGQDKTLQKRKNQLEEAGRNTYSFLRRSRLQASGCRQAKSTLSQYLFLLTKVKTYYNRLRLFIRATSRNTYSFLRRSRPFTSPLWGFFVLCRNTYSFLRRSRLGIGEM